MLNQGMTTHDETSETPVKFIKKLNSNTTAGVGTLAETLTESSNEHGLHAVEGSNSHAGTLSAESAAGRVSSAAPNPHQTSQYQLSIERPGAGCIPVKGLDR